jgi:hypothetical protein
MPCACAGGQRKLPVNYVLSSSSSKHKKDKKKLDKKNKKKTDKKKDKKKSHKHK